MKTQQASKVIWQMCFSQSIYTHFTSIIQLSNFFSRFFFFFAGFHHLFFLPPRSTNVRETCRNWKEETCPGGGAKWKKEARGGTFLAVSSRRRPPVICAAQFSQRLYCTPGGRKKRCSVYFSYLYQKWVEKRLRRGEHGGACHPTPAAGAACKGLILQCHQLFVREQRRDWHHPFVFLLFLFLHHLRHLHLHNHLHRLHRFWPPS